MRLELEAVPIRRAGLGSATRIVQDCLEVARDELIAMLSADGRLAELEIEFANPEEDCRIAGIFDIFEPRFRTDGRPNFPGVIDPLGRAGEGLTAVARGAAVVVLNGTDDRFKTTIDMSGPGAKLSPYSQTANVCIRSKPAPGVNRSDYYRSLKEAGLKAAVYLGQAARRAEPQTREVFDLNQEGSRSSANGAGLPRVAYIYMLASQQVPTEPGEPILYGDNVRNLLPTALHPNEILDGAVVAPYWNFGGETYSVQNHPMILELYRHHRRDLTFAGVIVTVAMETEAARTRSALMAATLARETLKVDAVILTKYGGGIPESAMMETFEACEDLGMKGVIVVWSFGGDGRIEGTLTFMSPRANAVVSCGINDELIDLPPVARIIGSPTIGPLIMEAEGETHQSSGSLRLRYQHIAGAINQLGGGYLSIEEY